MGHAAGALAEPEPGMQPANGLAPTNHGGIADDAAAPLPTSLLTWGPRK
jgi:hypothetical protein